MASQSTDTYNLHPVNELYMYKGPSDSDVSNAIGHLQEKAEVIVEQHLCTC